jgi:hypothetical protein
MAVEPAAMESAVEGLRTERPEPSACEVSAGEVATTERPTQVPAGEVATTERPAHVPATEAAAVAAPAHGGGCRADREEQER